MKATEGAASPAPRLEWQIAKVDEVVAETYRVKTVLLKVPTWTGHLAGQHVDIRLTAEGGYQVERSYSISSPPHDSRLALTVERVENGVVSPYLVDELRTGDQFELRGPIGRHFVWSEDLVGPLCLIAGGSGIAPLMAMLRQRARAGRRPSALLLYSSRSPKDIIFREELDAMAASDAALTVVHTLTRAAPAEWTGRHGRIDKDFLRSAVFPPEQDPNVFICGPTPFAESVSTLLVELGHNPLKIKIERFGPSEPPRS